MIAAAEGSVSIRNPRDRENIVKFDPHLVKAPFLLRCGALLADYVLLVSVPALSLVVSRSMGNDGAKLLNSDLSNIGWFIAVLLGFANFILLPMFAGQTVGKILTGLEIVNIDGTSTPAVKIILRQTFGYLLTAASFGLGFFISALNSNGRSLHDYLAGTIVIYANKRPL